MTKEEKSMVKLAAEAPEQFDSIDSMMAGAKCAANWIKEAKHLVAFTGTNIFVYYATDKHSQQSFLYTL